MDPVSEVGSLRELDLLDSGPRVGARGQAFRRNDGLEGLRLGEGGFQTRPYVVAMEGRGDGFLPSQEQEGD